MLTRIRHIDERQRPNRLPLEPGDLCVVWRKQPIEEPGVNAKEMESKHGNKIAWTWFPLVHTGSLRFPPVRHRTQQRYAKNELVG